MASRRAYGRCTPYLTFTPPEVTSLSDRLMSVSVSSPSEGHRLQPLADSTGRCNTLRTAQAEGVLQMKYRT